ncbi:MAG: hypothetical protein JWO82_535, partial [Akkermansiaceae bacterium]|nr:hypothetical protein [Akkermansiaceae bacterium]
ELARLELEKEKLEVEKLRLTNPQAGGPAVTQASTPAPSYAAPSPSELAEANAKIQELEEEKQKAERDSSLKDQEAGLLANRLPKTTTPDRAADKVSRRMAMIQQATLMGRVTEWVDSPDAGSFATVEITSPENVQAGTELLIRRNGGILGKLRVDQITPDGTIANPVTKFAGVKPVQGDELILEPPFVGPIDGDTPDH